MKENINKFKEVVLNFIKEKKTYCIIGVAVVLIILALVLVLIVSNNKGKNYHGNLINNGFVVKSGEWTYYLKKDGIYKVNSDESEVKINSNNNVSYLNAYGKYLYFVEYNENNGKYNLAKMKTNGEEKEIIIEDVENRIMTVSNDWIYYFQDDVFYKVKINGKDKIKLSDKNIVSYQIKGNTIYYAYKNGIDCSIAKMKVNGENSTELEEDCNPNFYVKGNKIYFIKEKYDVSQYNYEYTLCKMNVNGKNNQEIVKLPNTIKQINMSAEGVYYLKTEDYIKYELCIVKYGSTDETKITETTINTKINVIKKDVYYTDLNEKNETVMYRIKTEGTNKQML